MASLFIVVFLAAFAFPVLIQGAAVLPARSLSTPKAIYFMTNLGFNTIVAIPVAQNGTLVTPVTTTPTGGNGSASIDPTTGGPSSPDPLANAAGVQVAGQNLFVVNAGSNTLSIFHIDEHDPTKLTLLGEPRNTNGEFPITVAVLLEHQLACVANTGTVSGIACASYSPSYGLAPFDTLRNFNLNQTTPPVGLRNTISHIFFDNAQKVLFAAVKGGIPTNPNGFLSAYKVDGGRVSYKSIRSSPGGTRLLFGTANIPGSTNILASDASGLAAVISVNASYQGSTIAHIDIPQHVAVCWATFSAVTGTGYITDGAVNSITEVDVNAGTLVTQLNSSSTNFGMNDVAAVGNRVYALSPNINGQSSAISVFDISGGKGAIKEFQTFLPGGINNFASGLAWIR